jgi:hypothetical protein
MPAAMAVLAVATEYDAAAVDAARLLWGGLKGEVNRGLLLLLWMMCRLKDESQRTGRKVRHASKGAAPLCAVVVAVYCS